MTRIVRQVLPAVLLLVATGVLFLSTLPTHVSGMPASPPAGWRTFVNRSLNVALDYPAEWAVAELPRRAVFTSPQVGTVQLGVVDTGPLTPEAFQRETQLPNTRCTARPNRYGVKVRDCFDTAALVYTADFITRPSPGATRLLILVLSKGGDLEVFRGMSDSVRPAR